MFIVLLMTTIGGHNVSAKQLDESGVFDFNNELMAKEPYQRLDGEWHFFEKMLLSPIETKEKLQSENNKKVLVPNSFKKQMGKINSFGTYSATIKIPKELVGKALAIHVPYQYSAYTLFADQTEIARNGVVGETSATHIAEMRPSTGYFFTQSDEVFLTFQVSSFDHIRGGFENSVYFGEAKTVTREFNKNIIGTLFMIGCIFIIGFFMVLLALYRRQELGFFIFGIFAMLISIRTLFTDPFYYTLIFREMSWLWGTRLEYILNEASSWFYLVLVWHWYKDRFSKKVLLALSAVLLALILATLLTQPVFFQALFFKVYYLTIPTFAYLLYVIYKEICSNNRTAKVHMLGIIIIFLAFFNDFSIGNNWYQFRQLMLPTVAIYVMIHIVIISKEFSETISKTEKLNKELRALNSSLDDQVSIRTNQLQKANDRLEQLVLVDSLTGISNRRNFNEFIAISFQEAIEKGGPLSLLMLDLDEFKKYNDYYGHIEGDRLLQKVVGIVDSQLPEHGFFARYGGEEFIIVLPYTPSNMAYKVAEKIRQSVELSSLLHPESKLGIVTFSIGVATMVEGRHFYSESELINAADQQLYQSKISGRNRVL